MATHDPDLYYLPDDPLPDDDDADARSPLFAPYPHDVRYHFAPLDLHDVAEQHLLPAFDPRYPRDPHLLPHPPALPYFPDHLVDLAVAPPALSPPAAEYTFSVPAPALEPYASSRSTSTLSSEHSPQISLASSATSASAPPPKPAPGQPPPPPVSAPPPGSATQSASPLAGPRPARREASNVVIACRQCRARKIRCDSTRPVCHNCTRRNNECEYDSVPKRRGPDKRPGTRQRSCKKRPVGDGDAPPARKRRRTDDDAPPPDVGARADAAPLADDLIVLDTAALQQRNNTVSPVREQALSPRRRAIAYYPAAEPPLKAFSRELAQRQPQHVQAQKGMHIPPSPSMEYLRTTWWEQLAVTYTMSELREELKFVFTAGSFWLSFFHLPSFLLDLHSAERRSRTQPALIMAGLALATLMKSSQIEQGAEGRSRALFLRDSAQALLEAACNTQSIDYRLAEAALILALFETSCHPAYTPERAANALQFLDRIVQVLSLTAVDVQHADASTFSARAVPAVHLPAGYRSPKKCSCTPGSHSPGSDPMHDRCPCFSYNPPWDPAWSESELRREECRRLCWSALTLVTNYTFQCAAIHQEPQSFALSEPGNYALLFPGEAYERVLSHKQLFSHSPKESLGALNCRSMLLFNGCIRRRDEQWTAEQRTGFAMEVLAETRAIMDALDMHACNLDPAVVYGSREILYNTRMSMTHELRRLNRLQDVDVLTAPIFDRRQAEEWLYHQDHIAKLVKGAVLQLAETTGHILSRHPFQINWFTAQVTVCLALWNFDHTLTHALELAKSFLLGLDVFSTLWPCAVRHIRRRDELRKSLEEACTSSGLRPPLPPELNLPPMLMLRT